MCFETRGLQASFSEDEQAPRRVGWGGSMLRPDDGA